MTDPLVKCHFSVSELEYIQEVIRREAVLAAHVKSALRGLEDVGVYFPHLESPALQGKLLSYIRKGNKSTDYEDLFDFYGKKHE